MFSVFLSVPLWQKYTVASTYQFFKTKQMQKRIAFIIIFLMFLTVQIDAQTSDTSSQNTKSKTPKFGKGIAYIAQDSSFSFLFHFRMQHLLVATFDEASKEWSSQFLVRRARLKFGGYALTPQLSYKVELGISNRDISIDKEDGNGKGASRIILDAVLKWKFSKNWALWVGQTKLPSNRERTISSSNLQFVNRSLVNSRFTIDRDMALQLKGKYKLGKTIIAPSFSISQGEGRNITSLNFGGYDYTARLDFLPTGAFAKKGDYIVTDFVREKTPKIAFGVLLDYNDRAVRQGGQIGAFVRDSIGEYAENSLTTFMADVIFKYRGFSFLTEYATKSAHKNIEGLSKGFKTGNGFVIQAGYLFKNNVELAARYTTIRKDNRFSSVKDEDEITIGFSKYIVKHFLKIQTDLSRTIPPLAVGGKVRFRAQLEMQF